MFLYDIYSVPNQNLSAVPFQSDRLCTRTTHRAAIATEDQKHFVMIITLNYGYKPHSASPNITHSSFRSGCLRLFEFSLCKLGFEVGAVCSPECFQTPIPAKDKIHFPVASFLASSSFLFLSGHYIVYNDGDDDSDGIGDNVDDSDDSTTALYRLLRLIENFQM